jgi:hypothetical protein
MDMHGVNFHVELPAIRHCATGAAVYALCSVLIKGQIFTLGISGQLVSNWRCGDSEGRSASGIRSSDGYGVAFGDVTRHAEGRSRDRSQHIGTAAGDGAKIAPTVEEKFFFLAAKAQHETLCCGPVGFDDVLQIRWIRYRGKYAHDGYRDHQFNQSKTVWCLVSGVRPDPLFIRSTHFTSFQESNNFQKEISKFDYMDNQQLSQESGDKRSNYRNRRMDNATMHWLVWIEKNLAGHEG